MKRNLLGLDGGGVVKALLDLWGTSKSKCAWTCGGFFSLVGNVR